MKRLPIVLVALAALVLTLAGCSNPVNSGDVAAQTGEFSVFVDMDQAKGLFDYNVMHVYIKGFQVGDDGALVALQNLSAQATTSNGRYLTELLPVYDEKSGFRDPFTRTQIGYSAWFKFDTGLAPNRALKFVAWAVKYNGVAEQARAFAALAAWRANYELTASCETAAWSELNILAGMKADIADLIVDVKAAYEAAGLPYSPYPPSWWAPVLGAVNTLEARYDAYVAILGSQAYINWIASGPGSNVENKASSPAAAAKAAYDAAMTAFITAWSNYSAGTPSYPSEPSQVTDVTYDLFAAIMTRNARFAQLFATLNCLADTWVAILDMTNPPAYNIGSKQALVVAKKAGELTGHTVIYHTEANRYFPLPSDGIKLFWSRGSFQPGNTGPGGGIVLASGSYLPSLLPGLAPAVAPMASYVAPKKQAGSPQFVEVALADAGTGTGWYYSNSLLDLGPRDVHINAALLIANSVNLPGAKYGTNGVTGWTLGNPAQLSSFASTLELLGSSNGNLVGKWPNAAPTYYWTYDAGISGNTGYGRSSASYDIDGVLISVSDAPVLGFGTAGLVGNIRPVMAWGGTSNWANNNTPWNQN